MSTGGARVVDIYCLLLVRLAYLSDSMALVLPRCTYVDTGWAFGSPCNKQDPSMKEKQHGIIMAEK